MNKPRALTATDLRQVKTAARQNRRDALSLAKDLRNLPKERRDVLYGEGLWWAWVYEFTAIQHLGLWLAAIGFRDELKGIMEGSGDKAQAIIDLLRSIGPDGGASKYILEPEPDEKRKALASSLFISLLRQFECLENKGCYLSDLVEKVSAGKDKGDAAFFNALQIDRTIVSCPTFGTRISRAALEDDDDFFKSLANNMRKKRKNNSPKKSETHNELRLMLQVTHEAGMLGGMSMTEADKLFIQELSVYPDDGEDPARGLQRFINRWRNNK